MRTPALPTASVATVPADAVRDRRGSPIPTGSMIATRIMELRKRRGLMIALIVVNIGIPTVFLVVRLLAHAIAPKSYGPAGGYDIYTSLCAGVLYVFGFIVAATLGCTAGSVDLTEGMFRHLVVTGRSRLALYLARIPAGLAIVMPLVAAGFIIVCSVCVFAAPTRLNYDGTNVPAGLSRSAFENWAGDHPKQVICDFGFFTGPSSPVPAAINSVPCGPNGPIVKAAPGSQGPGQATVTPAQLKAAAILIARAELYELLQRLSLPVGFLDDQNGAVDRARGSHRVHCRTRTRIAARAENRPGDIDDRARDHPHAPILPSTNRPPVEPAAFDCRRCHGPLDTGGPSRVRRRWRRSGWRTGESLAGAGVGHLGRLGHRRVARGLDGSRSMADDDERRLGHTESRGDWPVTVTSRNRLDLHVPTKGTSRYSVCGSVSTRAPGTSSAGRFGCDQ